MNNVSYHIIYHIYHIINDVSENKVIRQRFASVPQTTIGAALTLSVAG
jgi:hypothetical protein